MKTEVKYWKNFQESEKKQFFSRSELDISRVIPQVENIIEQVKTRGDAALQDFNTRFDKAPSGMPLKVSQAEWEEAERGLSPELREALDFSIENVRRFHESQKPDAMTWQEIRPGVLAGEKATPLESAGLYIPRGRGSFPSMLYMLAVPAQVAGVPRICVTTPPDHNGNVDAACLYAARKCGISEIYKTGGAQAIAALAFGTESIPAVKKLTGPGSMYVTAAKRLLYSAVDVGLPAGPSESILLADKTANAWHCALDLLVEAEHGSDSSAVMLTDSQALARETCTHINSIAETLPEPRKSFISDVFAGYGGIVVTDTWQEAVDICNRFAPEHLEILTEDPFDILGSIQNAGEILLGDHTPFSCANYSVGANAVLPTGGKAATFSAVSVRDFIKYSSVVYNTARGLKTLEPAVCTLADYEGFVTHKQALSRRNETK